MLQLVTMVLLNSWRSAAVGENELRLLSGAVLVLLNVIFSLTDE